MIEEKRLEQIKGISHIEKTIHTNKDSFHVSRMPPKKLEIFRKLASEDFCNDYGMTISFLLDYYFIYTDLLERVNSIEKRILKIESKDEEKPKGKKMLNGKRIGGKE